MLGPCALHAACTPAAVGHLITVTFEFKSRETLSFSYVRGLVSINSILVFS